ncbi:MULTISPECIES: CPBP family intramembrane glutamic endopeptidase [unclassified Mycolicibacterium]|uniref:Rv0804 family intramembrane glutamic endopeptidase n=1 Tax=unclassified Mycolicibacterium TaxID=2636767 RepID=UPI0012DC76C1|nr:MULTISPECIES: CPBP family intramembrane glutamic endopeptidase [unclassified Mycolicibacterium]MUL83847.1 CPBP family intramembrane metalloprotease [Mycolicibacterium sp. CBMA 329]MUL90087.1 CPBP family intramembrane metalloprotease [Mycolicibacterium sp. CBMA 331]MUL97893.1 CPBP family intramembrane metalloprotease [Mycolicibacterium sp. CBMA 334]MUM39602.1 CPBP family intramembrane metalloprotease [Mycolicibacterium sp. CBMA 247]MUM46688.1 CPBP family intramembrane metalloprotease [Mycoli
MTAGRIRALALAVGLVVWNGLVDPRVPARWRPLVRVVLGSALMLGTGARPGLRPPALWSGLRLGAAAATAVTAGVAATSAASVVRTEMRRKTLPEEPGRWLALRIPLGTVWPEEAAFRAALGKVGADAFGPSGGQVLQSTAFGLSHIADARAAGEPVIATVLVTGAAGWVFGWLAQRSASLAAPMLAHLALNEAGALAALAYRDAPAALPAPGSQR